jgi:hypothetical protein
MKIKLFATYEDVWWDDDRGDDPFEERGYTDPTNPWGGPRYECPPQLCGDEFLAWRAENARCVELDPWAAAEMVLDFPGAVWDFNEGESEQQTNGHWRNVTLHVENNEDTVFALAETIEALRTGRH